MPRRKQTKPKNTEPPPRKPVEAIQGSVPLTVTFPLHIFLPTGALAYRVQRSSFLDFIKTPAFADQMAAVWDSLYEQARVKLNEVDPQTVRPVHANYTAVRVEAGDVAKALDPSTSVTDEEPEETGR